MTYQCGWCGKVLLSPQEHMQHIEDSVACLKRTGPISPVGFVRVQQVIESLRLIALEEKLNSDNELMVSEAKSALSQIYLKEPS